MDAVEVVRQAFQGSHMWYEGTVAGVTDEEANAVPPGVAHPIGELAAHILHCEDGMINVAIRGKPAIWEAEGWGDRVNIPMLMDMEEPGARTREVRCSPQQLDAYAKSVFANTASFLDGLTAADLDGELDLTGMGMGKYKLGEFLMTMLLGNNYAHTGEISTIKGMLGNKGYPF